MERKLIVAIDFNNTLFGSYYGEQLINSRGINVNAIKGFFFKIKALKDAFNPDYIVFANDVSRELTFRRKMYPQYKAQRKPHDEDIARQMTYASRLAALVGYPFINNELYEADDVLGMISRLAGENDMDTILVSSDKDLYQLLNDYTFIYSSRIRDVLDESWLMGTYNLTPAQWIELKIIQGDRSDNIPGIPGIGEVTALKAMQQYGSIENIYNHLGSMKPRVKMLFEAGRDSIPLTRDLVTIVTDYTKIGLTLDMFNLTDRYESEALDLLRELELYSLLDIFTYSLFQGKEVYPI